jgi:hypothetical protein
MIFGLQVASKVFTIICDVELGKPYMIPLKKGRSSVRGNNDIEGRGEE